MQFAGIRTDENLQEIESPHEAFIPLPPEVLPEPDACLVSGLTPQVVLEKAGQQTEWDAISAIEKHLTKPCTTVIGFNNLRFDDEFIRYTLYRNLFDPYEREWKYGNGRADLHPIALLCGALRPEGITWPAVEDGPSFKLDILAQANGIEQTQAHDALSDVRATIDFARLLRKAQPKFWEYACASKDWTKLLFKSMAAAPVLHPSNVYGKERRCVAPLLPIIEHPLYKGNVVCCDLGGDLEILKSGTPTEIHESMYRPKAERGPDEKRVPLVSIKSKTSLVSPLGVLDPDSEARLGFTKAEVLDVARKVLAIPRLRSLLDRIYSIPPEFPQADTAEGALYQGFIPNADRSRCKKVHDAIRKGVSWVSPNFEDPRLRDLEKRFRSREIPSSMSSKDQHESQQYVRERLEKASIDQHLADLKARHSASTDARASAIATALIDHDEKLLGEFFNQTLDADRTDPAGQMRGLGQP